MTKTMDRCVSSARSHSAQLALTLAGMAMVLIATVEKRCERVRASGDRGSESVEKAVLVAIGLAIAIGLGFAIRAAVQNYQGQIN
ncbi:hypothetical protein DI005_22210 [Prauserella sp. PE36]|uniref:hypothetical protein n=1 Tax=Prauserella sp. PE36 TaxID=1504709 RepID=UPI000DE32F36|nr:hypothetical protein [Prauserella sp. PE36]RBM17406.1 hypothetical protein DI005_22210 [Prauserella sp. PE36]